MAGNKQGGLVVILFYFILFFLLESTTILTSRLIFEVKMLLEVCKIVSDIIFEHQYTGRRFTDYETEKRLVMTHHVRIPFGTQRILLHQDKFFEVHFLINKRKT